MLIEDMLESMTVKSEQEWKVLCAALSDQAETALELLQELVIDLKKSRGDLMHIEKLMMEQRQQSDRREVALQYIQNCESLPAARQLAFEVLNNEGRVEFPN